MTQADDPVRAFGNLGSGKPCESIGAPASIGRALARV
jgi:hypothetical protein